MKKISKLFVMVACAAIAACTSNDALPPTATVNVAGEWLVTMDTPLGPQRALLTLSQEGDAVSGKIAEYSTPGIASPVKGKVTGEFLSFENRIAVGQEWMVLHYVARLEAGGELKGGAKFAGAGLKGESLFVATRR